jgi:hypothetical protein
VPKSFVPLLLLQGRRRIVSAALMLCVWCTLVTAAVCILCCAGTGREHNVFFMPAAGAAQKFGGLRAVPDALAAGEILKRIRAIDLYRSRREIRAGSAPALDTGIFSLAIFVQWSRQLKFACHVQS